MGQKADPVGLRLGVTRTWDSLWFSRKNYADFVREDMKIRSFLKTTLGHAGVSRVVISRSQKKPSVTVYVTRPGLVIGKKGAGIETLMTKMKTSLGVDCAFNIVELRRPELYAQVVADDIAQQLQRRVFYKRAMRKALAGAMKTGAKGIRVACSGRLGGIEIARTEQYLDGRMPLHTLRSDIDFACSTAHTTSGTCGVKVWIYRGDVLGCAETMVEKRLGEVSIGIK